MPAHKQRRLFDVEREAERALHDLANISPPMLLHQLLRCGFAAGFHSLHAAIDPEEVKSVGAMLARVKHLLWCGEDRAAQQDPSAPLPIVEKEHLDEVVTAFALAERQVTKATSVVTKLGAGVPSLVDLLITSGRAPLSSGAERDRIFKLAARNDEPHRSGRSTDVTADVTAPNGAVSDALGDTLPCPQVREYACEASGGRGGCSQRLFVRTAPDLFRIAVSSTVPPL